MNSRYQSFSLHVANHTLRLLLIITLAFAAVSPAQNRVVSYYPGWMKTKLPANKVMFQVATHINHAFAWPLADGRITQYDNVDHPELIAEAHKAGRKILISLGGWGQSDGFSPLSANANARTAFIQNLVQFLSSRGYDGSDFDWEFPQNNTDRANQVTLMKEVREAFNTANSSWLITMAVSAGDWYGRWSDYTELLKYVDWFNAMTYDFHGSWTTHAGHNSPLYAPANCYDGSVHQGMQYLNRTRGIPKERLHVGMPFYGREFNASSLYGPFTGVPTQLEYSSAMSRLSTGWRYHWDDFSKVPYLFNSNNTRFVTFDDSLSISYKCAYAKDNGYAGVMIWALGQDVMAGAQPLMQAVGIAMGTVTAIANLTIPIARDFELLNNYPNPFNPSTTIEFRLQRAMQARLTIYDLAGKLVAVLADGMASEGISRMNWNAGGFASGVYVYRLEAESEVESKKMLLVQ